jgi:hypothetical protein
MLFGLPGFRVIDAADSSAEAIVLGARCPTNAAAVGRFEDCSLRSLYIFARS